MAKVPFAPENKSKNFDSYPKLSLDKGERARIVLLELEPEMEWVHGLRKPQLDEHGKPVYKTRTNPKTGQTSQELETDFVGQHICLGDLDVMTKSGSDPVNCPTCRAAAESSAVAPAKRRFAMHVLRYKTQPGSFNIQEPFQAEVIAWVFAEGRFDTITDLTEEWGDLRKRDLMLGPCEVKQFQKFDIQVANKAEWLADDSRRKLVAELYKNNKITGDAGLQPLIGRRASIEQISADIATVLTTHEIAFGAGTPAALTEEFGKDVSALLDASPDGIVSDPLDEAPSFVQEAASADTAESDILDVGDSTDQSAEAVTVPANAAAEESLDSLLDGL